MPILSHQIHGLRKLGIAIHLGRSIALQYSSTVATPVIVRIGSPRLCWVEFTKLRKSNSRRGTLVMIFERYQQQVWMLVG